MQIFNIVAGIASILSLLVSLLVFKGVRDVKVKIGFTHKSQDTITQKASGNKIKQAGRDVNG